ECRTEEAGGTTRESDAAKIAQGIDAAHQWRRAENYPGERHAERCASKSDPQPIAPTGKSSSQDDSYDGGKEHRIHADEVGDPQIVRRERRLPEEQVVHAPRCRERDDTSHETAGEHDDQRAK